MAQPGLPGSREADNYLPGGKFYRGPLVPQQNSSLQYSIPTGGFMGQNQIGGQSSINVYRAPPPALTPEQQREKMFEDRANQYQQEMAELNLSQREAELEQKRIDDEQITRGKHRIDGRPVSAREMFEVTGNYYQQDYTTPQEVTPEQKRTNSIRQSLKQFQQNPMQFLLGGGQNVGELLGYLNTANQLFKATGQEGNFMDSLFGSLQKSQGNVPRQSIANRPAISSTKQNSAESLSEHLSRVGVRPEDQARIIGALGPSGRGSYVAKEFAPR